MQIRAPAPKPFTASVVLENGYVVQAAPILSFMKRWSYARVRAHCNKKGWEVSTVRRPDP